MQPFGVILVNFGGPRDLSEIKEFLQELLTDRDVIRTSFPVFLERRLFKMVAKQRARAVRKDYEAIGGRSPIFFDTEWIASRVQEGLQRPVLTFHRYLPKTHPSFIKEVSSSPISRWKVFPFFPQFSYATTGSIARFFAKRLQASCFLRMEWVKSYGAHPLYMDSLVSCLREFFDHVGIKEDHVQLVYSAHGLPERFIQEGDPYQRECEASFALLAKQFPKARSLLSYQSQFGRQKWIGPSTLTVCQRPSDFFQKDLPICMIPLSFLTDHIETLFEMEHYVRLLQSQGFTAYRCPALNRRADWIEGMQKILLQAPTFVGSDLIRKDQ